MASLLIPAPFFSQRTTGSWTPKSTSRQHRIAGGQHIHRGSPGYYEVILFLFSLGKNSKYKIILIKVKIHHLDFNSATYTAIFDLVF